MAANSRAIVQQIRYITGGDAGHGEPAAYLDLDSYVPVPLESTYQSAWFDCPDDMREYVEQNAT